MRPCLVVQNDANNERLDDTIVVMISSRIQHAAQQESQLLIRADSDAGRQAGLLFDSAVLCQNIVTIDRTFVKRRIGSLTPEAQADVNTCLRAALGL